MHRSGWCGLLPFVLASCSSGSGELTDPGAGSDSGAASGSESGSSSGAGTVGGSRAGSTSSSGASGSGGPSSGADASSSGGGSSSGSGSGSGAGSSSGPSVADDGGAPTVCAFASGVNVAWVSFGADVPNPNIPAFQQLFQNTAAAGGRVVRWWFHTNASKTPAYDASGMAQPLTAQNVADVKKILDAAHAAGVGVDVSLWSFDMLKSGPIANNMALLTQDANRQAYIDNVLTPLVTALKDYPGLHSWETFNEPEGMTTQYGWTTTKIDESAVQKTVNWFAAAIHAADPAALVTNGTWQFRANSPASGMTNRYSDAALTAAGGKANGTLDFYEVHYYAANGSAVSPFMFPYTHWALDKKTAIGEFYALAQDGVAAADTYTALWSGGYSGGWAWQYEADDGTNGSNNGQTTKWPTMQVPMQNLLKAHPEIVDCR